MYCTIFNYQLFQVVRACVLTSASCGRGGLSLAIRGAMFPQSQNPDRLIYHLNDNLKGKYSKKLQIVYNVFK